MPRNSQRPDVPRIAGINLDFRPAGYWADHHPVAAIRQNIKGENRRQMVADFVHGFAPAELGAIDPALLADVADEQLRTQLGHIDPSWMGGEYLPDYQSGEREIARIVLQSSTQDVFSLRARRTSATRPYRYRLVDEYESTFELTRQSSTKPLSLREVIDLIDSAHSDEFETRHPRLPEGIIAWELLEYGRNVEHALQFINLSSDVYPQLEDYYAQRLRQWAEAEDAKRRARASR